MDEKENSSNDYDSRFSGSIFSRLWYTKGRYSTKIDDAIFDPEGESERFGTKLYTTKPDLDAIGKLLEEGEEIDGAWRELGKDKVKVTPDKKLTALRVDETKKAESEQQKKA